MFYSRRKKPILRTYRMHVMHALQFCKLLSFSLMCNFEINLDFLFTRA